MPVSDNAKGIIYAWAAGFLWGVLAIILKVTLNYVSPENVVWFRFFVAFVILFLIHLLKKPKSLKIIVHPPLLLLLSAVFLGLNYIAFMRGINNTSPNNAAIFIQTGPLLLAIFGIVVYREKLSLLQITGFIIAIIGFVFFYRDQLINLFSNKDIYNRGVIYIVFAGVMWSFYSLIQKKLIIKFKANDLNLLNFGVPMIIFTGMADFSALLHQPWFVYAILLFLGLNTLIAYQFLSLALKYTQANKVSIILTANPIITFGAMAWLTRINVQWIHGEVFTFNTLFGAVFVISGAIIVAVFRK